MNSEAQPSTRKRIASFVVQVVRSNWLFFAFLLALVLAFVLLRTQPTRGIESLSDLETMAHDGQPVLLEFYSNL